jgi:hypothetical protein
MGPIVRPKTWGQLFRLASSRSKYTSKSQNHQSARAYLEKHRSRRVRRSVNRIGDTATVLAGEDALWHEAKPPASEKAALAL